MFKIAQKYETITPLREKTKQNGVMGKRRVEKVCAAVYPAVDEMKKNARAIGAQEQRGREKGRMCERERERGRERERSGQEKSGKGLQRDRRR